jgi:hypothetical protein
MNTQLFRDLLFALCELAGKRGALKPGDFYLKPVLRFIARVDKDERPTTQGKQIRKYLKFEIEQWNCDVWIRGARLNATQFRQILIYLFDLRDEGKRNGTGTVGSDRRLLARDASGLGVAHETWRSKSVGKDEKTGVEAEVLRPFVQHILEGINLRVM